MTTKLDYTDKARACCDKLREQSFQKISEAQTGCCAPYCYFVCLRSWWSGYGYSV